ncbi:SCO4402 family protein [Streptomyces noursei]
MSEEQIRLPEMREEVFSAVRALADSEYQKRVWIERKYPNPDYFDDFTLNVNILDDATILDNPHAVIGYTLASEEEAQAMKSLADRLLQIIEEVGSESPDSAFLASPLWNGVVEAAKNVLEVMTQ